MENRENQGGPTTWMARPEAGRMPFRVLDGNQRIRHREDREDNKMDFRPTQYRKTAVMQNRAIIVTPKIMMDDQNYPTATTKQTSINYMHNINTTNQENDSIILQKENTTSQRHAYQLYSGGAYAQIHNNDAYHTPRHQQDDEWMASGMATTPSPSNCVKDPFQSLKAEDLETFQLGYDIATKDWNRQYQQWRNNDPIWIQEYLRQRRKMYYWLVDYVEHTPSCTYHLVHATIAMFDEFYMKRRTVAKESFQFYLIVAFLGSAKFYEKPMFDPPRLEDMNRYGSTKISKLDRVRGEIELFNAIDWKFRRATVPESIDELLDLAQKRSRSELRSSNTARARWIPNGQDHTIFGFLASLPLLHPVDYLDYNAYQLAAACILGVYLWKHQGQPGAVMHWVDFLTQDLPLHLNEAQLYRLAVSLLNRVDMFKGITGRVEAYLAQLP